jgi:hypothetical protein
MNKLFAMILLMSLVATSCGGSGGGSGDSGASSEQTTQPITDDPSNDDSNPSGGTTTPPTTVPAQALSYKTNVTYLSGFSQADEQKYDKAVALVKKVVATEAFRKRVLNHTYGGSKTYVQNNGLSNAQIYQAILDAAEKLTPAKNNTMDVGVKLYYTNNSVVGYTNGSITYINVNTKFFNSYGIHEVAGNLFHEWLHKLGYGHDSDATARRPYSVPYAVGYMIRDIGKSFL